MLRNSILPFLSRCGELLECAMHVFLAYISHPWKAGLRGTERRYPRVSTSSWILRLELGSTVQTQAMKIFTKMFFRVLSNLISDKLGKSINPVLHCLHVVYIVLIHIRSNIKVLIYTNFLSSLHNNILSLQIFHLMRTMQSLTVPKWLSVNSIMT